MQGLTDIQYPILTRNSSTLSELLPNLKLTRKQWWILVVLNIFFLIAGQTSAALLGRFYYAEGGTSLFMSTLVQNAGFPIVCIPLILLPPSSKSSAPPESVPKKYVVLIYVSLGVLLAGDNLLYSMGLLYLSASTYSLISASQLAFNTVFSFCFNSQKITPLILNSVVILSFSAILLATNEDADLPGVSKLEYAIGFICTLAASAVYGLLLSLMQLTFQRVFKAETLSVAMEMQIYTSLVATFISLGGLFVSGQWSSLGQEMDHFNTGPPSYIMTLVWTAISWQVRSAAVVGLIFLVSSLFSNVISTMALAVAPFASLIVFHDNMNGAKAIALLLALWGFASYLFQNYLDDCRATISKSQSQMENEQGTNDGSFSWRAHTKITPTDYSHHATGDNIVSP